MKLKHNGKQKESAEEVYQRDEKAAPCGGKLEDIM